MSDNEKPLGEPPVLASYDGGEALLELAKFAGGKDGQLVNYQLAFWFLWDRIATLEADKERLQSTINEQISHCARLELEVLGDPEDMMPGMATVEGTVNDVIALFERLTRDLAEALGATCRRGRGRDEQEG